jgi:hypothetical protein
MVFCLGGGASSSSRKRSSMDSRNAEARDERKEKMLRK